MFSLYLHIPFCVTKCPYCDFNSYAGSTGAMRDEYVIALCQEIQSRLPDAASGRQVDTIFFGGGTPSLLDADQLERILNSCRSLAKLSTEAEITLEANPGTIARAVDGVSDSEQKVIESSMEKLKAFRNFGINRLSFGVQALDDGLLRTLGRVHTASEAIDAYHLARTAGFDNINLDFIFAIPGQTIEQWKWTLDRALELAPEHMSCYCLTVEEGTAFYEWRRQGTLQTLDEETEAVMFDAACNRLTASSYEHYEISNFAVAGKRCRHNITYWRDEDYLGVGAGAHSSLDGVRSWNERSPRRYVRLIRELGSSIAGQEILPPRRKIGESIMLGLRQREGIDLSRLNERFQINPTRVFANELERLTQAGLVHLDGSRLCLSPKGLMVANDVMAEFVSAE